MITGALKAQVDRVWDAFWSGGISNPMEVIEQISHLRKPHAVIAAQRMREHQRGQAAPAFKPVKQSGVINAGEWHFRFPPVLQRCKLHHSVSNRQQLKIYRLSRKNMVYFSSNEYKIASLCNLDFAV